MKNLYRIKQRCSINFCEYNENDLVMLDEKYQSKALTELVSIPETPVTKEPPQEPSSLIVSSSITDYKDKMIKPGNKKIRTKKQKKHK